MKSIETLAENFISYKNSLGFPYEKSHKILLDYLKLYHSEFDGQQFVSKESFIRWAELRNCEGNMYRLNRISVIREFSRYLNGNGIDSYILPIEMNRRSYRTAPHIYSPDELTLLFSSMDDMTFDKKHPVTHLTVPTIYRVIYCCGLRPIEARRLKCSEVDLYTGKVSILESKGHKDRIIMLSGDILELCRKYNQKLERKYPTRTYFFSLNSKDKIISEQWINETFRRHLKATGLDKCAGSSPRLYDLRHTFATHRLYQWMKEGKELNSCLPFLCEYMGHSHISSTAYYLHLIPDFFEEMSGMKLDTYADSIPEVNELW